MKMGSRGFGWQFAVGSWRLAVFFSGRCRYNTILNLEGVYSFRKLNAIIMGLFETIKQILSVEGELKAREITRKVNKQYNREVSKSEINSILYSYENIHFELLKDFKWRLLYGSND